MPPPRPALPSSRAFVTDLLRAIAADAPPDLAHAPDATRKLIIALHVLFPEELLPALDLLDRGLVTRFVLADAVADAVADAATAAGESTSTGRHDVDNGSTLASAAAPAPAEPPAASTDTNTPLFYVRSAQPRRSRFASSVDSRATYEVRLSAWNCTCPAFAFAAFPAAPESPPPPSPPRDANAASRPADTDREQAGRETGDDGDGSSVAHTPQVQAQAQAQPWTFGGRPCTPSTPPSLHARTHAQRMPPTCKHLLACVLAEQCGGAFKCAEQRVSADEAAGWAAGWGDC